MGKLEGLYMIPIIVFWLGCRGNPLILMNLESAVSPNVSASMSIGSAKYISHKYMDTPPSLLSFLNEYMCW